MNTNNYHLNEHETKYVFHNSFAPFIIQWLKYRCRPDPIFPSNTVSSIYYDTMDWRLLREKINSDYLKTKVRIRWYTNIHTEEPGDESYLEAKYKVGARRKKIRKKINISGRWLSHIDLDNQELLTLPIQLLLEDVKIPSQLFPAFQISYERRRFIEPITGARLCLDYNIRTPCVSMRMLHRINPFPLKSAVFELKGGITQLPDALHQLTDLGCRKQSFSKYRKKKKNIMRVAF